MVPPSIPSQYQRGSRTPASITTPVVISTGKAARPINGLGIGPNALACQDCITEPQATIGLRLHPGTNAGSSSSLTLSNIIMPAIARPMVPQTIKSHGKILESDSFLEICFITLIITLRFKLRLSYVAERLLGRLSSKPGR